MYVVFIYVYVSLYITKAFTIITFTNTNTILIENQHIYQSTRNDYQTYLRIYYTHNNDSTSLIKVYQLITPCHHYNDDTE